MRGYNTEVYRWVIKELVVGGPTYELYTSILKALIEVRTVNSYNKVG